MKKSNQVPSKYERFFEIQNFFMNKQKTNNNDYITCASSTGEIFINGDVNISKEENRDIPNFNTTTVSGSFNVDGEVDYGKLPEKAKKFGKDIKFVNIPSNYMIKRDKLAQKGLNDKQIDKIYKTNRYNHFKYKQSQKILKVANKLKQFIKGKEH